MKEQYNLVELFSGIGSQARALKNIGIKTVIQATCEWDIHAFIAYDAIHNCSKSSIDTKNISKKDIIDYLSRFTLSNDGKTAMNYNTLMNFSYDTLIKIYSAIKGTKNLVDINNVNGSQMPNDIDIMTYSFPCQDLSNVGAFHGYTKGIDKNSGSRSSLLWQVGRILTEMKNCGKKLPRYLIMENVPTLLSLRHIGNFTIWKSDLENLGYISKHIEVNARNYGIPQNRPRLLMLSVYVGDDEVLKNRVQKYFDSLGKNESKLIDDYANSPYYKKFSVKELLRVNNPVNSKLWLEEVECTPNDTPSRKKIWNENPKIIDENNQLIKNDFIRTLTTKQDRHPNSGNIYFDCGINGKSKFRYLTPRECLLFMGFTDNDYEKIIDCNVKQTSKGKLFPRDKIIRMAGNSIPVKMLEGFFYQFYKLEDILLEP